MPHLYLTGGRPPRSSYMRHEDFKHLVDRIGVKQKVLAAWLGVSARTLRYWLSGDINAPKAVVLVLEVLEVHKASARRQARQADAPSA